MAALQIVYEDYVKLLLSKIDTSVENALDVVQVNCPPRVCGFNEIAYSLFQRQMLTFYIEG